MHDGCSSESAKDVVAAVRRYIDAFNKATPGNGGLLCRTWSILDGMAPHVWHGPTVAEDWYRDVLVEELNSEP
jgi:hypothetical protein